MTGILRYAILAALYLQASEFAMLEAAKQHVQLSDSYLPVAMQVIAHLTDQMAFEVKEEPGKPTTRPSTTRPPTTRPPKTKPTVKPLDITTPFHRPGYYAPVSPPKPSERVTGNQQQYNLPTGNQQYNFPTGNQQYNFPTENQQYNFPTGNQQYNFPTGNQQYNFPIGNQQYNAPGIPQQNQQQQYARPAPFQQQDYAQNSQQFNSTQYHYQQTYYVPSYQQNQNQQQYYVPPDTLQPQSKEYPYTQSDQFNSTQYQYQYSPFIQNQQQYPQNPQNGVMTFDFPQYNPIQPQNVRNEEPLLSAHYEEVKPLLEPTPEAPQLLPPHFETDVDKISSRSKGFDVDELTEENLQYLSQDVREMLRMANDPNDERLVDVWEGLRANPAEPGPKGKLSASNLRLLLLYDLLSREAKRQRLSDYAGFSPDVMKTLVESSSGGARAQLRMALSKMVERHDCAHEYANNRAKEMVAELAKDESKLSSEIRYLQPLVYKY